MSQSAPSPVVFASPPQRLLVRGVNWLGDAVMTTPALLRLRDAWPGTRIHLLTPAKLAELWRAHPAVDEVLTFGPGEGAWTVGGRLRAVGFDAALVLPNSPRSALECFLGRVPVRVGFARRWRNAFLTHRVVVRGESVAMVKPSVADVRARLEGRLAPVVRPPLAAHHSLQYLAMVAACGASSEPLAPRLAVSAAEVVAARAKFGLAEDTCWLGLNPGAEYGPAKRWPAGRFAAVAQAVTGARDGDRGHKVCWIMFGGRNDHVIAAEIRAGVPGILDLAGRTTLREFMAVLRVCRVLLTNDTGPMHVAAALGVPVVVPFGSTSPELTGPGLPGDARHRWVRVPSAEAPCAPCFLRECPVDFRCLLGVGVERVTAEVLAWVPS